MSNNISGLYRRAHKLYLNFYAKLFLWCLHLQSFQFFQRYASPHLVWLPNTQPTCCCEWLFPSLHIVSLPNPLALESEAKNVSSQVGTLFTTAHLTIPPMLKISSWWNKPPFSEILTANLDKLTITTIPSNKKIGIATKQGPLQWQPCPCPSRRASRPSWCCLPTRRGRRPVDGIGVIGVDFGDASLRLIVGPIIVIIVK